jgi:hypothetical protein
MHERDEPGVVQDGRPALSWQHLELPFGEWAAQTESRFSLVCDSLQQAELLLRSPSTFAVALAILERRRTNAGRAE